MGTGIENVFLQSRYTNRQQVYKMVLDITNHKGNENQ